MILCAAAGYYLTLPVLRLIAVVVEKTETDWDDDLLNAPILKAISRLTPVFFARHVRTSLRDVSPPPVF